MKQSIREGSKEERREWKENIEPDGSRHEEITTTDCLELGAAMLIFVLS